MSHSSEGFRNNSPAQVTEFHQCAACHAMVSGPHACSPFALGHISFATPASADSNDETGCRPARFTEERIRAIVREELAKLMAGNR